MATLFISHDLLMDRCRKNSSSLSQVEHCITRRVSAGVFVDDTKAPDWLVVSQKRGLGDMVADGLAAVGITKERVSKAIGRPCGCDKRQKRLNDLGRRFGIG
jgi:hypothetical protein